MSKAKQPARKSSDSRKPGRPAKPASERCVTHSITLQREDAVNLRRIAAANGLSVSAFIRSTACVTARRAIERNNLLLWSR